MNPDLQSDSLVYKLISFLSILLGNVHLYMVRDKEGLFR
ncbi:unnamed protein product, partial [Vitis vinifera]